MLSSFPTVFSFFSFGTTKGTDSQKTVPFSAWNRKPQRVNDPVDTRGMPNHIRVHIRERGGKGKLNGSRSAKPMVGATRIIVRDMLYILLSSALASRLFMKKRESKEKRVLRRRKEGEKNAQGKFGEDLL